MKCYRTGHITQDKTCDMKKERTVHKKENRAKDRTEDRKEDQTGDKQRTGSENTGEWTKTGNNKRKDRG